MHSKNISGYLLLNLFVEFLPVVACRGSTTSHLFIFIIFICQAVICAGVGRAPAFAWALAVPLPSPSQAILI